MTNYAMDIIKFCCSIKHFLNIKSKFDRSYFNNHILIIPIRNMKIEATSMRSTFSFKAKTDHMEGGAGAVASSPSREEDHPRPSSAVSSIHPYSLHLPSYSYSNPTPFPAQIVAARLRYRTSRRPCTLYWVTLIIAHGFWTRSSLPLFAPEHACVCVLCMHAFASEVCVSRYHVYSTVSSSALSIPRVRTVHCCECNLELKYHQLCCSFLPRDNTITRGRRTQRVQIEKLKTHQEASAPLISPRPGRLIFFSPFSPNHNQPEFTVEAKLGFT